jgi:hypothetical protein
MRSCPAAAGPTIASLFAAILSTFDDIPPVSQSFVVTLLANLVAVAPELNDAHMPAIAAVARSQRAFPYEACLLFQNAVVRMPALAHQFLPTIEQFAADEEPGPALALFATVLTHIKPPAEPLIRSAVAFAGQSIAEPRTAAYAAKLFTAAIVAGREMVPEMLGQQWAAAVAEWVRASSPEMLLTVVARAKGCFGPQERVGLIAAALRGFGERREEEAEMMRFGDVTPYEIQGRAVEIVEEREMFEALVEELKAMERDRTEGYEQLQEEFQEVIAWAVERVAG